MTDNRRISSVEHGRRIKEMVDRAFNQFSRDTLKKEKPSYKPSAADRSPQKPK